MDTVWKMSLITSIYSFFLFGSWPKKYAQSLLLTMCLGVTTGGAQVLTRINWMQFTCLDPYTISLDPLHFFQYLITVVTNIYMWNIYPSSFILRSLSKSSFPFTLLFHDDFLWGLTYTWFWLLSRIMRLVSVLVHILDITLKSDLKVVVYQVS